MFADRLQMYRERGAGVYGTLAYFISSLASIIPQAIVGMFSYAAVAYPMTKLNPGLVSG